MSTYPVKHLNISMDWHKILCGHSWFSDDDTYFGDFLTFALAPPWRWHLWFWVKYLQSCWMDCHEICSRHSCLRSSQDELHVSVHLPWQQSHPLSTFCHHSSQDETAGWQTVEPFVLREDVSHSICWFIKQLQLLVTCQMESPAHNEQPCYIRDEEKMDL